MTHTVTQPEAQDSIDTLLAMLQTKRPAGSKAERKFISRFIIPLGAIPDKRGNLALRIGTAPIMWSCHTDSVHSLGGTQRLQRIGNFGIGLAKDETSNCLGADDAAGIWLMCEMIRAKVEGLYIFHRDEEHGCKGSRWLVKNTPKLVEGIRFAVALDRRDKDDIITFQNSSRCCSDEFAESLGTQLDMGYKPSPNGSFTDTAQYTDLIGECTNLSVGYKYAHSSGEEQDGQFLIALRDKLLHVNVAALVEKRKAGTKESRYPVTTYYGGSYYYGGSGDYPGKNYPLDDEGLPYPRPGTTGYWDANKQFHDSYTDKDMVLESKWEGGEHYYTYRKPPGIALKAEEQLMLRRQWWERVYHKTMNFVKYGQDVRPREKRGTSWYPTQKRPTTSVVKTYTGASHSKVRTIREELESTAAQDEFFTNGGGDNRHGITLERLCRNHPEEVAAYLEEYGVDADEISLYIMESGGILRCH